VISITYAAHKRTYTFTKTETNSGLADATAELLDIIAGKDLEEAMPDLEKLGWICGILNIERMTGVTHHLPTYLHNK